MRTVERQADQWPHRVAMPWYHNTDAEFEPGDEIVPASESGHKSRWAVGNPDYDPNSVYFTNEHHDADANALHGRNRYEIEPIGEVKRDPEFQSNARDYYENEVDWEDGGVYNEEDVPGYHSYSAPRARVVRRGKSSRHIVMPAWEAYEQMLHQARHILGECKAGDPNCSTATGVDWSKGFNKPAPGSDAQSIMDDAKGGKFNAAPDSTPVDMSHSSFGNGAAQGGVGGAAAGMSKAPSAGSSGPSSPIDYEPSSGVEQWRDEVNTALERNGLPTTYADQVLKQVGTESSGNPNAQNNWDSNAQKGTPSGGLLQTIGPTYDSFKLPGAGDDLFNPQDNLDAAVNYAKDRYGPTLMDESGNGLGSGHGY